LGVLAWPFLVAILLAGLILIQVPWRALTLFLRRGSDGVRIRALVVPSGTRATPAASTSATTAAAATPFA